MVDYFALIAPTIESLSKSTVEERRQVYDRLIKMLEAQLRSADPPRSEIDILRERIDLEAAIRRVERRIQAGQIAVGSPLSPDALKPVDEQMGMPPVVPKPKSLDPVPVVEPGSNSQPSVPSTPPVADETQVSETASVAAESPRDDVPQTDEISPPEPISPAPLPASEPPQPLQAFRFPDAKPESAPQSPRPTDWASLVPQPRPVDRPPNFTPRSVPRPPQPNVVQPREPSALPEEPVGASQFEEPRRPASPSNMTNYSDQPPGPPRRPVGPPTYAPPSQPRAPQAPRAPYPAGEPDAGRAIYGQRGASQRQTASQLNDLPAAFRSLPGAPGSRPPISRSDRGDDTLPPLDPAVVEAGEALSRPMQPRRSREPVSAPPSYTDPTEFLRNQSKSARNGKRRETIVDTPASETARPTVAVGERPRASMLPTRGSGGWRRMAIITSCIVVILGGIAMTAYLLRDDPAEFENASGKYAASEKPQAEEKIGDRLQTQAPQQNVTPVNPKAPNSNVTPAQNSVVQPAPSAPTPDANGVLTQKAMLVMESPDQSAPTPPLNGRVTWKLETLKSVVANASEIGSRATVDVPDVGLSAAFVFRRNRDPQSANSHMIEVTFTLADNNSTGKVRDIRVPELRGDETSRGTPLSGIPVPVTENVFLVGLNALPTEMQKNLDLLRSQNWFAMPLRFANGKRGMLMFEKGKTGERVMEDAMQAWKSN